LHIMQDIEKYKEKMLNSFKEIKTELETESFEAESILNFHKEKIIDRIVSILVNNFLNRNLAPEEFFDIETEKWHYRVVEIHRNRNEVKAYTLVLVKKVGNEEKIIPWEEMHWKEKFDMVFNFPEYLHRVLLNLKEYKNRIERLKELYKETGNMPDLFNLTY
jgi:hypothetical protein